MKLVRRSECWMPDTKAHLLPLVPYLEAAASGYHRAMRLPRGAEKFEANLLGKATVD